MMAGAAASMMAAGAAASGSIRASASDAAIASTTLDAAIASASDALTTLLAASTAATRPRLLTNLLITAAGPGSAEGEGPCLDAGVISIDDGPPTSAVMSAGLEGVDNVATPALKPLMPMACSAASASAAAASSPTVWCILGSTSSMANAAVASKAASEAVSTFKCDLRCCSAIKCDLRCCSKPDSAVFASVQMALGSLNATCGNVSFTHAIMPSFGKLFLDLRKASSIGPKPFASWCMNSGRLVASGSISPSLPRNTTGKLSDVAFGSLRQSAT